jgi:FMN reductase
MSERTLVVISGGLRHPSSTRLLADQLTAAVAGELTARDVTFHTHVVDLREHAQDITNNLVTGFAAPALQDVIDTLVNADGVIAVSPIFNASYSGLFKSFFDVLPEGALLEKPVLIGATGGTARHSLTLEYAMRPLFAYLRADVVPTAVFAASSDFGATGTGGSLSQRIDRAAAELADRVLRRGTTLPDDPFENPTPFEDLLRDS